MSIEGLYQLFGKVYNSIDFSAIFTFFTNIFSSFINSVAQLLHSIGEMIWNTISAIVLSICDFSSNIQFSQFFERVCNFSVDVVSSLFNYITLMIIRIYNSFGQFISDLHLLETISKAMTSIFQFFVEVSCECGNAIFDFISNIPIGEFVSKCFMVLYTCISSFIQGTFDFICELFKQINLSEILYGIVNSIYNYIVTFFQFYGVVFLLYFHKSISNQFSTLL
ncbi:hypothetical protein TRFO_12985 [Tritrichomonas foetus]|uniref:Uncharacterized protein n=1 Tax=Tritrichomonas foetus TaxID=1144522 RepID=A0A1J4L473_9EUKA|nr:hypothetical protein TRFO_12985 [Tritrichomonas foetus]|eukprot:OHT16725.1 hypothetical protein TRFO_12985 [Tritrichomonas foetus]